MRRVSFRVLFLIAFLASICSALLFARSIIATDADNLLWGGFQGDVQEELDLGNADPRVVIAGLVRVLLGFLGIIVVIMFMIGGFKWMLSGGNEDSVAEAKSMMISAVIGLLIILASWSIATFLTEFLFNATSN